MTTADIRRMVSMVRAIKAGKWTDELPTWAAPGRPRMLHLLVLQQSAEVVPDELRAIQTAEAFILLVHASGFPFNETQFLKDCGFIS